METQAFIDFGTPRTSSTIITSVKILFLNISKVLTDAVLSDEGQPFKFFAFQTCLGLNECLVTRVCFLSDDLIDLILLGLLTGVEIGELVSKNEFLIEFLYLTVRGTPFPNYF